MPGDEREARIPSNMKDLLKFCMENTKSEDAPSADTSGSEVKELGSEVSWFLGFFWLGRGVPFYFFFKHQFIHLFTISWYKKKPNSSSFPPTNNKTNSYYYLFSYLLSLA